MAKVTIDLVCERCGKEFTHTKYCCNSREANTYENWATDNITMCPDCYSLSKIEEVEFDNIVELTGTDRQIQYARAIRAKTIKALMRIAGCDNVKVEEAKTIINEHDTAVWWIDNQDKLRK